MLATYLMLRERKGSDGSHWEYTTSTRVAIEFNRLENRLDTITH